MSETQIQQKHLESQNERNKKNMRKSHTKIRSSPSYTKAAGSRKIMFKAISK